MLQIVTFADEAKLADEVGADLIIVQGSGAGGHSGTPTPNRIPPVVPLPQPLAEVGAAVSLPLIGAGEVSTPGAVADALAAGATAVPVGTCCCAPTRVARRSRTAKRWPTRLGRRRS